MKTTRMPATNLDVMPPVGMNCTKKEIMSIVKLCIATAPLIMLVLVFILSIVSPVTTGAFIFIFSFGLTMFIAGGFGIWCLKKLGKMKNNKSSKYTMQRIEFYKRFIGLHDKRVIHSAKKWSTSR